MPIVPEHLVSYHSAKRTLGWGYLGRKLLEELGGLVEYPRVVRNVLRSRVTERRTSAIYLPVPCAALQVEEAVF